LITLLSSFGQGAKLETRMKAVAVRRDELKRRSREAIARGHGPGGLRHTDDGFKKRIVDRLNLSKLLEDPKVVDKLARAGFRGPRPVPTFYFFRFAMPFVVAAFVALYLFGLQPFDLPVMSRISFTVGGFVIGFYAPNLYVENRAQKRQTSIMQAFPDALDL